MGESIRCPLCRRTTHHPEDVAQKYCGSCHLFWGDARMFVGAYFGEAWPSGMCDTGHRISTPVGAFCGSCDEEIDEQSRGSFIFDADGPRPVHRECLLRDVLGGIGHLEDHDHWCTARSDPDGGRTRRESSLAVWEWVQGRGV